jgi:hypothetical protein
MISYSTDKSVAFIGIIWERPDKAIDLISFLEQSKDFVYFFQIYGDSKIYGKNALLYIGPFVQSQQIWKQLCSNNENISNLNFVYGSIDMGMWGRDPGEVEISLSILQEVIKPPYNLIYQEIVPEIVYKIPFYITNMFDRGNLPEKVNNLSMIEKKRDFHY